MKRRVASFGDVALTLAVILLTAPLVLALVLFYFLVGVWRQLVAAWRGAP